ncbi:MAG: N-acetylglucosamine-6-phosphate deacetylase [Lentisphaeria bacterium]|nr:N-acetylglucosamine-6-phosphate deacetylase [Lentisphaeria bacterium]
MGKNRILYLTDYCLTPHVNIPNAGILCENTKIIGIGGVSAFSQDEPNLTVVDMTGCYALPGLIDSHIHGCGGFDTELACEPEQQLVKMSSYLASRGVTSFFPTLVSMPRKKMVESVKRIAEMMQESMPGAVPCGLHLEGPFINPLKAGSQSKDACSPVDFAFLDELLEAGDGRIKLMTFAPELENAEKMVEILLNNGVIPSMGHSVANADETLRLIDAGARRCTHLFNGLPPLHHRRSSITDVLLTHDDVSVEIILDGAHIDPRIVDITTRVKPKDKVIGISNSIQFEPGQPNGYYEKNDRIFTADGILAGTAHSLDEGWMHLRTYSHLSNPLAAACFTLNPALDLGLITRGELSPGKRADITFFKTADSQVAMTISQGKVIYKAEA